MKRAQSSFFGKLTFQLDKLWKSDFQTPVENCSSSRQQGRPSVLRPAVTSNNAGDTTMSIQQTPSLPMANDPLGSPCVYILRDYNNSVPIPRVLVQSHTIGLLTPVVPPPIGTSPPNSFEPLGNGIIMRHGRLAHLGYEGPLGLDHKACVDSCNLIILVIAGPVTPLENDIARMCSRMVGSKPFIILVCCPSMNGLMLRDFNSPTVLHVPDNSAHSQLAAAAVLFGEMSASRTTELATTLTDPPKQGWVVEPWSPSASDSEMQEVAVLWNLCLPVKYGLETTILKGLLDREGYSSHFIVSDPDTKAIVGFCATYSYYWNQRTEDVLGSIAMLIVHPNFRSRGIGTCLYRVAWEQLLQLKGLAGVQLGTYLPRLLCGVPIELGSIPWFERRGWDMTRRALGQGQEIADFVMPLHMWLDNVATIGHTLEIRHPTQEEVEEVIIFVEDESYRQGCIGFFQALSNTLREGFLSCVMAAWSGSILIAVALIYKSDDGSPISIDLPWAGTMGQDWGGVTCILCDLKRPHVSAEMFIFFDACLRNLKERGVENVFIDAIRLSIDGWLALGFKKWAQYADCLVRWESNGQQPSSAVA